MKRTRVKSLFLRYLVMFFGHLGIQVIAVEDFQSGANFVFNIAINLLAAYGLSRLDILEFDLYQSQFRHQKPIYSTFLRICLDYILPISFVISKIFYFLTGYRLIKLLDSACFRRSVCSPKKMRLVILASLVVTHLYYFLFNYVSLAHIFMEDSSEKVKDTISYLSQYVIGFTHYFPCIVEHYFQYASHQSLCRIEGMLQRNVISLDLAALKELRELATVSEQVNRLMSFPVLMFVAMRVINGISVFCLVMLQVQGNTLFYIVPSLLTWLYMVMLMYLNRQTKAAFSRICMLLRGRHRPSSGSLSRSIDSISLTHSGVLNAASLSNHQHSIQSNSIQILFHQTELYRPNFEIRIFSMAQVDLTFLLGTTLFMLNYVVFLYQTN